MPLASVVVALPGRARLGLAVPVEHLVLVVDRADLEADQGIGDLEGRRGQEALARARLVEHEVAVLRADRRATKVPRTPFASKWLLPLGARDDVGGGGGEAGEEAQQRRDEAVHVHGSCRGRFWQDSGNRPRSIGA